MDWSKILKSNKSIVSHLFRALIAKWKNTVWVGGPCTAKKKKWLYFLKIKQRKSLFQLWKKLSNSVKSILKKEIKETSGLRPFSVTILFWGCFWGRSSGSCFGYYAWLVNKSKKDFFSCWCCLLTTYFKCGICWM